MKKLLLCIVSLFALVVGSSGKISVNAATVESDYTRYEAEDATITNCQIKGVKKGASADYGTYSGEGFVGSIDYVTSKIDFIVTVSSAGNYDMNVAYAIDPSFANATFNVYVNDEYYSAISLSDKKGWGNFDLTKPLKTTINLNEGQNKVTLLKGYNHAELDYIEIGKRNGDFIIPSLQENEIKNVPEGFTRYEAEDGKVANGRVYNNGSFSGTGFVGDLDYSGSSKIDFTVTVSETGEYDLRIAYAIGSGFKTAKFKVYNENGLYTTVTFDQIYGWGVFDINAIAESKISLLQGKNVVSLYKSSEYAQIDFIDISNKKTGEYKESGITYEQPDLSNEYVRYEAEDQLVVLATTKGIKYFVDLGEYSGYGYVGELDNDDCYIEIPISVAEDGEYEIKVCYAANEENASFKLYSGQYGRNSQICFYKEEVLNVANGWGMFSNETVVTTSICLKKGLNCLIIRSGLIRCEIDYVDLGSKIGTYYEGTLDESLTRKY